MPALRRLSPLLWLGPAIALIGFVVLWPVVVMVQSSFQRIGGEGFVVGYNGTDNYRHLFDEPDFVSVLLRTLLWVVGVVAVTMLISLALAQLLQPAVPRPPGDPVGADHPVGSLGDDDRADLQVGARPECRRHQPVGPPDGPVGPGGP